MELEQVLADNDARFGVKKSPDVRVTITNMGMLATKVSDILRLIPTAPKVPVRSGHVGNWNEIWAGRTGLVDYNRYICRDFAVGAPLLHCHTSVENVDRTDGDTIICPVE